MITSNKELEGELRLTVYYLIPVNALLSGHSSQVAHPFDIGSTTLLIVLQVSACGMDGVRS
jgi:hypothetical protein